MSRSIRPHHQKAIDTLVERYADDPAFPALIVGGSIAKGTAKENSDVDVMFVASEEEYARRVASGETAFLLQDVCDYDGGYIDAKVVDVAFLRAAAEHGSEPTRNAFIGTYTAYSRLPEVDDLLPRIPVYQEQEQREKIESFWSQMVLLRHFFWHEANKRNDPYLRMRVVTDLVLFGGRLILAHNKILFPCQKWLMEYVENASEKPADFTALAHDLLQNLNEESIDRFYSAIEKFRDWNVQVNVVAQFIDDIELTWLNGKTSIAEW